MSKRLKIIIAIVLALILALGVYIAPRVIPYTTPNPNIIKTDQGSFELRIQSYVPISILLYNENLNSAKDYYSRISSAVKNKNLIIDSYLYNANEGAIRTTITFTVNNQNNIHLFEAVYAQDLPNDNFKFETFFNFSKEGGQKSMSFEQLIQQQEYQNLRLN